ncbi:unnamed protein product [Hymenolepis diminuta]|nr:unnamed protein product [Hymenolepis diminuta]VUZ45392.1 unnamed protein product [Hymenolepis diminuta]
MAENALCGICVSPLFNTTGSPVTCDHEFHFGCLESWNKNNASDGKCKCPLATCDKTFICMKVTTMDEGSNPEYFPVALNYPCNLCYSFVKSPAISPSGCDHYFCSDCILQLSTGKHMCPTNNKPFTSIDVSACVGAPPTTTILLDVSHRPISSNDLLNIFWTIT